jgi:Tuberculosis necrotizing toxin
VFEIAAAVVPVTKAAQLAKLDKLADAAKVAGKLDEVGDAAKAAGGKIDDLLVSAKRILGDIPLTSKSLDDLYQAGKLSMDEARALAQNTGWKDAAGKWIYPPNQGFDGPITARTFAKGDQIMIDRYGEPRGRFVSPAGETYSGRALPPNTNKNERLFTYKIDSDVSLQVGRATHWFGEKGGALQYLLETSVEKLLIQDKLIPLSTVK